MNGVIFVRAGTGVYVKLNYKEIMYLKANRVYCEIVTDKRTYTISCSMGRFATQLDNHVFVRINRSYIVNITRITELNRDSVKFGNRTVPMMKWSRYKDILNPLKSFCRRHRNPQN